MMVKYTLDRFEGEKAVLLLREDEMVEKVIKREHLPEEAKEGDILDLLFNEDGELKEVQILEKETIDALQRAQGLLEKLKNKNVQDC